MKKEKRAAATAAVTNGGASRRSLSRIRFGSTASTNHRKSIISMGNKELAREAFGPGTEPALKNLALVRCHCEIMIENAVVLAVVLDI